MLPFDKTLSFSEFPLHAIFSCLNKINKQDSIEIIFMVLIILILPAPLWYGKTEEDSPISKTFLGTKKDFRTFLPENFI